jgi:hypothetical protein
MQSPCSVWIQQLGTKPSIYEYFGDTSNPYHDKDGNLSEKATFSDEITLLKGVKIKNINLVEIIFE